jgi:putative ABC transport system permease protein
VRLADILGLSLAALWQQKVRTLLTTLGVVFGSFVLAASLSINQGVQDIFERQTHRSDRLRQIDVRPGWEDKEDDPAVEQVSVKGEMSEARRKRIREALIGRKQRFRPGGPRVPLTRQRLRQIARIEHVEAVVPTVCMFGWAVLDGKAAGADAVSAKPDHPDLRTRVVAGRYFDAPDERSAVVSEFLLYQWGVADEAAANAVVGKTVRFEQRVERQGAGLGVYLLKPGGDGATREETSALDKIKKQLPGSLDRFNLSAPEKDALRNALREAPPKTSEVLGEEFTVVGVLRMPEGEEQKGPWDEVTADVFLPMRTAEEFFFRAAGPGDRGIDHTAVYVDREQHVKEVMGRVRELKLNAFGMVEFIERERLMYLLIFGAMTCVAGVALLVAALGIANTMLMSVLERTREVGIMKAVGAGNGHVQLIFLVEGALIGVLGGGLGLLLGWAASFPGDSWVRSMVQRDMKIELKESLFVFPAWLVLTVMGFAVLVTTLAAVYPARRAARVNPVTALRHE